MDEKTNTGTLEGFSMAAVDALELCPRAYRFLEMTYIDDKTRGGVDDEVGRPTETASGPLGL